MARKVYTKETKAKIAQMIAEGKKRTEISAELGVPMGSLGRMVAEIKNASKSPKKKCPKCGVESELHFNFCWKCGADLRSEGELLIEEVKRLRGYIAHLPAEMATSADIITKRVIAYLREHKEG